MELKEKIYPILKTAQVMWNADVSIEYDMIDDVRAKCNKWDEMTISYFMSMWRAEIIDRHKKG